MAIRVWCEPDNDGPDDAWVSMAPADWPKTAVWAVQLTKQIEGLESTDDD